MASSCGKCAMSALRPTPSGEAERGMPDIEIIRSQLPPPSASDLSSSLECSPIAPRAPPSGPYCTRKLEQPVKQDELRRRNGWIVFTDELGASPSARSTPRAGSSCPRLAAGGADRCSSSLRSTRRAPARTSSLTSLAACRAAASLAHSRLLTIWPADTPSRSTSATARVMAWSACSATGRPGYAGKTDVRELASARDDRQ